jgi:hypothetical protein
VAALGKETLRATSFPATKLQHEMAYQSWLVLGKIAIMKPHKMSLVASIKKRRLKYAVTEVVNACAQKKKSENWIFLTHHLTDGFQVRKKCFN